MGKPGWGQLKKAGGGRWAQFERGIEEYKEMMLVNDWWYNVKPDCPYLTKNQKRLKKNRDEQKVAKDVRKAEKEKKEKQLKLKEKKITKVKKSQIKEDAKVEERDQKSENKVAFQHPTLPAAAVIAELTEPKPQHPKQQKHQKGQQPEKIAAKLANKEKQPESERSENQKLTPTSIQVSHEIAEPNKGKISDTQEGPKETKKENHHTDVKEESKPVDIKSAGKDKQKSVRHSTDKPTKLKETGNKLVKQSTKPEDKGTTSLKSDVEKNEKVEISGVQRDTQKDINKQPEPSSEKEKQSLTKEATLIESAADLPKETNSAFVEKKGKQDKRDKRQRKPSKRDSESDKDTSNSQQIKNQTSSTALKSNEKPPLPVTPDLKQTPAAKTEQFPAIVPEDAAILPSPNVPGPLPSPVVPSKDNAQTPLPETLKEAQSSKPQPISVLSDKETASQTSPTSSSEETSKNTSNILQTKTQTPSLPSISLHKVSTQPLILPTSIIESSEVPKPPTKPDDAILKEQTSPVTIPTDASTKLPLTKDTPKTEQTIVPNKEASQVEMPKTNTTDSSRSQQFPMKDTSKQHKAKDGSKQQKPSTKDSSLQQKSSMLPSKDAIQIQPDIPQDAPKSQSTVSPPLEISTTPPDQSKAPTNLPLNSQSPAAPKEIAKPQLPTIPQDTTKSQPLMMSSPDSPKPKSPVSQPKDISKLQQPMTSCDPSKQPLPEEPFKDTSKPLAPGTKDSKASSQPSANLKDASKSQPLTIPQKDSSKTPSPSRSPKDASKQQPHPKEPSKQQTPKAPSKPQPPKDASKQQLPVTPPKGTPKSQTTTILPKDTVKSQTSAMSPKDASKPQPTAMSITDLPQGLVMPVKDVSKLEPIQSQSQMLVTLPEDLSNQKPLAPNNDETRPKPQIPESGTSQITQSLGAEIPPKSSTLGSPLRTQAQPFVPMSKATKEPTPSSPIPSTKEEVSLKSMINLPTEIAFNLPPKQITTPSTIQTQVSEPMAKPTQPLTPFIPQTEPQTNLKTQPQSQNVPSLFTSAMKTQGNIPISTSPSNKSQTTSSQSPTSQTIRSPEQAHFQVPAAQVPPQTSSTGQQFNTQGSNAMQSPMSQSFNFQSGQPMFPTMPPTARGENQTAMGRPQISDPTGKGSNRAEMKRGMQPYFPHPRQPSAPIQTQMPINFQGTQIPSAIPQFPPGQVLPPFYPLGHTDLTPGMAPLIPNFGQGRMPTPNLQAGLNTRPFAPQPQGQQQFMAPNNDDVDTPSLLDDLM